MDRLLDLYYDALEPFLGYTLTTAILLVILLAPFELARLYYFHKALHQISPGV